MKFSGFGVCFFSLVKGGIFRSLYMGMNPCSIYRDPIKIHFMKRKLVLSSQK